MNFFSHWMSFNSISPWIFGSTAASLLLCVTGCPKKALNDTSFLPSVFLRCTLPHSTGRWPRVYSRNGCEFQGTVIKSLWFLSCSFRPSAQTKPAPCHLLLKQPMERSPGGKRTEAPAKHSNHTCECPRDEMASEVPSGDIWPCLYHAVASGELSSQSSWQTRETTRGCLVLLSVTKSGSNLFSNR